jgi:GDP-mannose pyrophosphatase NudK
VQQHEHAQCIRIHDVQSRSFGWFALERYVFEHSRRDGSRERLEREVYRRGDSVAVLPFRPVTRSVVLVRQCRLASFLTMDENAAVVEAPGGLIGNEAPEAAARRETEEETGVSVTTLQKVCSAFTSPASLTERVHLYVAEVTGDAQITQAHRVTADEELEVLEYTLAEAQAMIKDGAIRDLKTIVLLYHLWLKPVGA